MKTRRKTPDRKIDSKRENQDTNEDKALVRLGGALEAAKELRHKLNWGNILQIHSATARHRSPPPRSSI